MSAELPAYVEYGSLATAPGPLQCSGARLWGFWVEGDRERIGRLCERVFAVPSGGTIIAKPLLSHIVLTFGEIERIIAGHDYSHRGNVTERQVGVWVPVLLLRRRAGLPIPQLLGAFIPYMWLDNPLSVASGREQYGYPKAWGWATFPGEPPRGLPGGDPSSSFVLDVYGLARHSPETKAGRERLLEVTPTAAGDGFTPRHYEGLGELLLDSARELGGDLGAALPEGVETALAESLLAGLRGPNPTINQLFLRQFRATGDGTRASQQQIVRAGALPTRKGESRSMGPHRIEVADLASHPLGAELGVVGSPEVRLPFTVEMDFTVDEGAVVWDSAG